jgi:proteasome accessory factor A
MMEKKIRGVEHELAMNTIPSLPHGSLVHLVGMAVEELKTLGLVTKIPVEHESPDQMALNGFRVYIDMSHLELSSPSYNSPLEAVIYDKVAELFGYHAVRGLKGYFKEVNVYKNNVSNLPTGAHGAKAWRAVSYSTHSSILMDRRVCNLDLWDTVEEALIPFMVARIPLMGGGDFVPTPQEGFPRPGKEMHGETLRFAMSPRAIFAKRLSSNDTVSARGLLNQRDDPHADPSKYWRLHDINWEGLRSPFQIYLRDSLETLVMTAYEGGYLGNPPKLVDPLNEIKGISLDTESCDWKVTLESGGRVDALADIMEGHYLAGIEKMLEESEASEEDRMGFNLLKAVLQSLGERRLEYFIDGLDWVTKKALIDEYAPGDIEEALGICNQYTLLDDAVLGFIGEPVEPDLIQTTFDLEASLEFARDAIPIVDWGSLSEKVKRALTHGPLGSREYLRGLVAREFPFMVERIEWERITFPNAIILLDEPFSFSKELCGEHLEEATTNFSTFLHAVNKLSPKEDRIVRAPVDDHELRDREGGVNH